MSSRFSISTGDSTKWDEFVRHSPQRTLYSESCVLQCFGVPIRYVFVLKGNSTVGGIALTEEGRDVRLQPYHAYAGIHFSSMSDYKIEKAIHTRFCVSEMLAELLFNEYRTITISNHWAVTDVRAFDWYNYHEREKGGYQIKVGYTSLLNLNPVDKLFQLFRSGRREDVKRATMLGVNTEVTQELQNLDTLHRNTFAVQGISRSPSERDLLLTICGTLIAKKRGVLIESKYKGKPAAASFWGLDCGLAHFMFGGSDPEYRHTGCATLNLYDAFKILAERYQINSINMVGVNSPGRGDFKLGFGGNLTPYFNVSKISSS